MRTPKAPRRLPRLSALLILVAAAVGALALGAASPARSSSPAPTVVTVYKSPSCGCCGAWVDYLRTNGYQVKVVDLDDLSEIKSASGVPPAVRTCHTAVVDGYVVEGHVPVDALRKLLAEKPKLAGIGVPGMPIGSPGMPGTPVQHYDVVAWDKAGKTSVYLKK